MKHKLRSAVCTEGRRMAGARALWVANGMKREQFGKPIIAVVNSFTQFVPGHTHLHKIGQEIKAEIEKIKRLINFFGKKDSQLLEYWFDNKKQVDKWKKGKKKGRFVQDDKAFYESLKKHDSQGRVLSEKQIAVLDKFIEKYGVEL